MNEEGITRTQFIPHSAPISALKFGNDASKCMLATCGEDRKLKIWDVSRAGQTAAHSFDLVSTGSGLNFNSEDSKVTTGLQNGTIKLWDLESCKDFRVLSGHRAEVTCVEHYEYHKSNYLATASMATDVKMWDIRKRGVLTTYGEHEAAVSCIRFSPDGRNMLSSDRDGFVKIWDLRSGKSVATKSDAAGEITDLQFHPSEMLFAASSQDGRVYFYDFENYQLVSHTEKSTNIPSAIRFSFAGDVLTALMGDLLAEFAWEPEAKRTKAIHVSNGKKGDLMLSQNKVITTGIKEKNQLIVNIVDSSKIKPKVQNKKQSYSTPKTGKANQSLPDPNISSISERPRSVRPASINMNHSNSKEQNTSSSAPVPKSVGQHAAFNAAHKLPRSPRAVKAPSKPRAREVKADFKMKQLRNENDIPVEIHVAPAPVHKSKRPLAMVKPNNSMEIDPSMLASPIQAEKPLLKPSGLLSLLQQSVEVKKVLKNRHMILEDCNRNQSKVEALRKSYRDRGAMYDILSNILSMPDVWTLELAVEAAQVASLLAQSTEEHHQKLSTAALKYILTSYRQTIENSLNAPMGIGVDLSAEQRQQRSLEVLRLVNETRNAFQPSSQNATTLKEIDFLMKNFRVS